MAAKWTALVLMTASACAPAPPPEHSAPKPTKPTAHKQTPSEAVREAEADLKAANVSFAKALPIDFYLYFSREAEARKAEQVLKAQGFRVSVRMNEQTGDWGCKAGKDLRPGSVGFRKSFESTMAVADQFGGLFDGWELALR